MTEELEFYADDIEHTCPVCGSTNLVEDFSGSDSDAVSVSITCLDCFATFYYRPKDDDDIPW